MGSRIQKRLKVVLPVRVSGKDADDKPFNEIGHTLDVNAGGTRLGKIPVKLKVGDEVIVFYRTKRARFMVRWIGPANTPVDGHLGLECLEKNKDMWPLGEIYVPPEAEQQRPDDFEPAVQKQDPSRRKDDRYPCTGTVEMRPSRRISGFQAKLGDISAEGCHVLTPAGLPLGTTVVLLIKVGTVEIEGSGVVRAAYPGEGMGIQFTQWPAPRTATA